MKTIIQPSVRACAAAATVAALAACTSSQTGAPSVNVPSNPLSGKLELAVGTANIFGDAPAAAKTGLNVVVSFRQPNGATKPGDSDALVNTPTLTLPAHLPATPGSPDIFGATIETGPGPNDAGGTVMRATPQQNPGNPNIPPSTFGVSGGAFGLGLFPGNYSSVGNASVGTGVPDSLVPYKIPLFDPANGSSSSSSGGDPNAFEPWGGPPAFDPNHDGKGTRDGTGFDPSVLGVSEGLDVFEGINPVVGTYKLSVLIPTNSSSTTGNVTTTASLRSAKLLPSMSAPVPSLDGNGGGSFAIKLPAGVTEAYLQITDFGPPQGSTSSSFVSSCNGSNQVPVYYTLHATASLRLTLPDNDGPGNVLTTPPVSTPSLCTPAQNSAANGAPTPGDSFVVQVIGFDYPIYAASYPMSLGNPAPTLTSGAQQADITISSAVSYGQPAPGSMVRLSEHLRRGMTRH